MYVFAITLRKNLGYVYLLLDKQYTFMLRCSDVEKMTFVNYTSVVFMGF